MKKSRQSFAGNDSARFVIGLLLLLLVTVFQAAADEDADEDAAEVRGATLIVTGARIWTGDRSSPWAEALAIRRDKIIAVGTDQEIDRFRSPDSREIDAQGKFLVPGFIDCHVHFITGGLRLASVQLRDAASKDDFRKRIREFAAASEPRTWITGGDWDHTLWGGELPTRTWIDAVTLNTPVWVNRLDGHMALANTAALRAAGVDRSTPDVAGGTIVRDETGEPTGILKDNAMRLIERVVPERTNAQKNDALEAAMQHFAAQGVTSVHHMGSWADLEVFERARREGNLKRTSKERSNQESWPTSSSSIRI